MIFLHVYSLYSSEEQIISSIFVDIENSEPILVNFGPILKIELDIKHLKIFLKNYQNIDKSIKICGIL